MKHSTCGKTIILLIIAVLSCLPFTASASGEVEYTTDPVILPGYDELNMFGSLVEYYPLDVPIGRHGLQPELKLIYNNVNTPAGNILGAGWSLSLPIIERVNKHGTDVLYDQADFTSSLSDELIQIAENSYGTKVDDDGSFLDYELSSAGWTVTAKDGLIYTFGDTANTRLADPVDSTKIFTWYLTTIQDTNGNFITYSYEKDESNNAVYPETITYTNDASGTGPYTITFTHETRPDPSISYAAGWLTQITERISAITITANDSNVRTYRFGYTIGDNGVRSLLSTISASGENTAGTTVTLPDTSYVYTAGDATLTYNAEIDFPNVTWTDTSGQEQTAPFAFSDDYVHVMDVNGDGLHDIIKSYNTEVGGVDYPIFWVLINNGHGWEVDTSWTQPEYTYVNGDGTSLTEKFTFGSEEVIGDWNGDAKDDLMLFWAENIGGGENLQRAVVLLNTGDGWEQDTSVTADIATITDDDGTAELYVEFGSGHFVDLNGDGLLDFVSATSTQTNGVYDPHFAVWYNQNGSLVYDDTVAVPWVEYTASGSTEYAPLNFTSSVRLLEVNGDGLIDFLYANNYQINGVDQPSFWVLINNGHGWTQDTTITHPTYEYLDLSNTTTTSYVSTSTDWSIMDVNGDYLSDLVTLSSIEVSGVRHDRTSVLINTGHGWTQDDALLTVGDYEYTDTNNTVQTGFPTTDSTALFFDVNGDGLDDIVNAEYSQSDGTYYTRNWVMENTGDTANLLEEILLPAGGQYTFTYKSSSEYADDDGQLLNQNLPATHNTLFSVTSDDGTGTTATTTYEYADGSFYYADQYDRRFAGFGMVTKIDAIGQKTITYYHQGNGLQTDEHGSDAEDGSMIEKMYREEVYDSDNNLYRVQLFSWQSADLENDRTFVYLEDEFELQYDDATDHTDSATSYTYDSTTGTLRTQVEYGEVIGSNDGSYTDTGDDDRTTTYAYATDPLGVIISLPSTIMLTDTTGTTVSEIRYTYDDLSFGNVATGNITQEESWITDTHYATTVYTYDTYGNRLTQTDPLGNTTTTTYDPTNHYPATITNALGQVQTFEYNKMIGQPKSVIEVNGAITETDYDGLGRPIEERRSSDVTATNLETTQTWDYNDTSLPQSVTHRSYLSTTSYQENITYVDGLNRVIAVKKLNEDGTGYNEVETTYDTLGYVATTTLPHDDSAVDTDLIESYTYDAFGRVTAITNVLGTTTTDYDGFTKTMTDALSNQKDYVTDGLGRLISVIEYVDGVAYTTNYTWDAADHLITTSDALGNIRNFTYDGRGLQLTAEDLHDSTDTTFGTWVYIYDDAGNRSTTLSPNNVTVTSGYDELNRQITENADATTETDITYTYDSCTNGTGKLCAATTSDGVTTTSSYTAAGRLSSETKTISAVEYTTNYTYDTLGNIFTTTHPDGTIITNTYNAIGLLATVTGGSAVVTDTTYGPHGQVTSQTNANDTTTTYTYDENERYRLTRKLTTGLQDLSYTYDAVGNVTQIIDASETNTAKTTDYTYDDLYRLLSATISGAANGNNTALTYAYDAIGNVIYRSDFGTYSYDDIDYANPHAVTSILMVDGTTATYSYDNNGNLTSDGTKIYSWDYKNRLASSGELTTIVTPITTSNTVSFYPTAGDGYTYKSNASWDTAHDAPRGNYATATATTAIVGTYQSTAAYYLTRAFLPFDTSSLPDDATVTDTTLKLYVVSKKNNDNDGDDWVTVVQGSQPSISTLTTADYDLAGSVNSPTEGIDTSERKDITNISTGAYLSFDLNTTGLGWISQTDATKLALREGHDVIDSAFTSDSITTTRYNRLNYRSSEYASTAYDPYLEVTYTQPSTVTTITTTNEVLYAYDHTAHRISKSSDDAVIYYPSDDYSSTDGTSTLFVFGPNGLTASIEYDGTTSTTETIHADHLGSTNVVTDESGVMIELLDYHPYGDERMSWNSSSESGQAESQKTFLGEYSDDETELSYLNARYYDPARGQFLSQDPVFLAIGTDDQRAQTALLDPQLQNSYGYSKNNPMTWKDPDGSFAFLIPLATYAIAYAPIYVPVAITWSAAAVTAITVPLFGGAIYSYGNDNAQLGDAFIEAEMSVLDIAIQTFTGLNDLDQNGFLDSSGLVDWAEEGGGQLEVNTKVESTATVSDFNMDEYLDSPREFNFDGQPGIIQIEVIM